MTTAAARPKRPARPTLAVGKAPLAEVGEAAAEEARDELAMTDAVDDAARDVVAGAVTLAMTDETDEPTEEAMEDTTGGTDATAEVVAWAVVAGADVINALVTGVAVGAAAEVEACWPTQLESELPWTVTGEE